MPKLGTIWRGAMSIPGKILRVTGLYERLKHHFVQTLVMDFATRSQIRISEVKFLGEIARNIRTPGPIIEIGTLFGRSTMTICANKEQDRPLTSVDFYGWNPCGFTPDQHFNLTRAVLREAIEQENVELIRMDKNQFYRTYDGAPPAMVFLDADHSYEETLKDIKWAQSVNAHLICGHDYIRDFPGVIRAVDECGGVRKLVSSLWILEWTPATTPTRTEPHFV